MKPHLYELVWLVETDVRSFLYREFKVFNLSSEAKEYGIGRETELNGGISAVERAQDGYYFKYSSAHEIEEIDGFTVDVA